MRSGDKIPLTSLTVRFFRVRLLPLSLVSSITLGRWLHPFQPLFLYLINGNNNQALFRVREFRRIMAPSHKLSLAQSVYFIAVCLFPFFLPFLTQVFGKDNF